MRSSFSCDRREGIAEQWLWLLERFSVKEPESDGEDVIINFE
ncbi:hypothetical protein [Desulfolucanica intricata]|nr:hypothetical protein [Desulfolucanica intricata]